MDDKTHSDSDFPENLPGEYQEVPTPDPHATDPVPPVQEGQRAGTDDLVRPEQDEPLGPPAELVKSAGAKVKEEATPGGDAEAEALLAKMGVEEEGIESGQLLGLVAAVLIAVVVLAVTLIYAFYTPYRTAVGQRADSQLNPREYSVLRTEAEAKILNYARTDSTYQLPVSQAMGLVAAEYADGAGVERSRGQWNTFAVRQMGMGRAVQATPEARPMQRDTVVTTVGGLIGSDVEVGSDVVVPPVDVVETDGAIE